MYKYIDEKDEKGKAQHLHTLNGVGLTGTSTVLSVLSKPLTYWASGLAVATLGWTKAVDWRKLKTKEEKDADLKRRIEHTTPAFEQIKELSVVEYISLLDKAYKAHAEKLETTAEAGTDLHSLLEIFVKNTMLCSASGMKDTTEYDVKIKPFIEWTTKNVKRFLGSETYCFSESLFVGGITDAVAELNNGEIAIIDFKSAKDAYASHFFQIAGYDLQISENGGLDKNGNVMFKLDKPITQHIVVPFGAKEPYPVVSRLVDDNKEAFKSALSLYRILAKLNKE